MKFNVTLIRKITQQLVVEVEAADDMAAGDAAERLANLGYVSFDDSKVDEITVADCVPALEDRMVHAHRLGMRYYHEHLGMAHGLAQVNGEDERASFIAGYRGAMCRANPEAAA